MLRNNELVEGNIYRHDNGTLYAKLVRVIGNPETGGGATIEIAGEITTMGLALFMRKFNAVHVKELADRAYEDQG